MPFNPTCLQFVQMGVERIYRACISIAHQKLVWNQCRYEGISDMFSA